MSHLVGSTSTLIVALCLLVIVGSLPALPAVSGLRARIAPLFTLLAILAAAAGIWLMLERPGTLLDQFPGRIVRYGAEELNAAKEPTVLIIDGGSYVINGVDCNDLMKELRKLGYKVRALRLASGAANHFERFRMQQRVVKRLRSKNPKQRWVFLAEVQHGYDSAPLAQFTENPSTDRAYDYSTLANAWYATTALRTPNVTVPPEWRWSLFRSTLINSFNAGALLRLSDEDTVDVGGGRVAARKRSKVKIRDGVKQQIAMLDAPPKSDTYPWIEDIRERRIRRLWKPYLSDFVYFGLPSSWPEQLAYIRKFCSTTRDPCIAPADAQLLSDLDDAEKWRDRSHMSKKGATIYTRWLAQELVRRGIVK